tara:strand:- start:27684 stop:28202 length:519 start_codon:yes stop_codon:yes gene_type:complete
MNNKYLKDKYCQDKKIVDVEDIVFIDNVLFNKIHLIAQDVFINNIMIKDKKYYFEFMIENDIPYLTNISGLSINNIIAKNKIETSKLNLKDLLMFDFEKYLIKDIKNNILYTNFKEFNKIKNLNFDNLIKQKKMKNEIYQVVYSKDNKGLILLDCFFLENGEKYFVRTYSSK